MTAVAMCAGAWKPTNSNAASALTETAAGIRTGRVLVKAGERSDTFTRYPEDCRSAPEFQAPSCDGRVNLWRMPDALARSPIGRV